MKIKLICDSLCDIPMELAEKYDIEIMPLTIIIDGKEYKDGIDMTNEEFYETMKKISTMPKTSQATYMQFKEVFDKYKDDYSIICITGSSRSSGTYQSAVIAKNDTDGDIHIFDTLNLSLGSGQFVIKACQLIDQNLDAKAIVNELEDLRESVNLFFVPGSLEYLKRSGRVSVTSATIGNMLSLKPIFSMKDGNISLVTKVRGKKHVIHTLIDLIKEQYDSFEDKNITIGCGENIKDFEILKKEVEETFNVKNLYLTRGGACICSHTGPDILAISCSN
ncbi:degV family protein [[Clostridium] sordellii]|uniref:DegV family protein n=1 Tax=Paraclostridium sordellii TaxID=1505 RepID=UPI0005E44530|nr:DegV family protein [Paeniclostridium sordellii]CEQ22810.1 degV family protein [[Clostridium] sordellii] [Paeniclostridium sordellii]